MKILNQQNISNCTLKKKHLKLIKLSTRCAYLSCPQSPFHNADWGTVRVNYTKHLICFTITFILHHTLQEKSLKRIKVEIQFCAAISSKPVWFFLLNSRRFHHNLHKVLILTASLCELNKKNHFFVSKAGSEVQLYQIHLHEVLCWGARMRCLMWSQNVDLSHEMLSISSTFWLVFPKVHNEKETFLLILFFSPPPLALVLFYI